MVYILYNELAYKIFFSNLSLFPPTAQFEVPPPSEKTLSGFQQAGKKEGGLGEVNFRPPVVPQSGTEGGKRFRNSALAEYQNRKIFISLIEKILARGRLKNVKKIFLFCSPKRSGGGRKRWAGLPPTGRQLKVAVRIFVKKSSDFVQKVPPFLGDCCLALASLGLGFRQDFEGIFEVKEKGALAQAEVRTNLF